jgi:predicted sulfurtransferase
MKLTCSILGFENVYNLDGGILNWHYDVVKGIPEERKHIKALLQQIEEPKGGRQE